jgi:hypothetical protein
MRNIHLILVNRAKASLYHCSNTRDFFTTEQTSGDLLYELYITSDEEIKEGDWLLVIDDFETYIHEHKGDNLPTTYWKKIILTTDPKLIEDGVHAIDDEFLEWFIKNPSCEEVEVQKWFDGLDFLEYKIIIPQEEPKERLKKVLGLKHLKQETLEDVTEQIQNECHKFVENVSYVTYQDATNTFIFMKLAELTLKLKNYEK